MSESTLYDEHDPNPQNRLFFSLLERLTQDPLGWALWPTRYPRTGPYNRPATRGSRHEVDVNPVRSTRTCSRRGCRPDAAGTYAGACTSRHDGAFEAERPASRGVVVCPVRVSLARAPGCVCGDSAHAYMHRTPWLWRLQLERPRVHNSPGGDCVYGGLAWHRRLRRCRRWRCDRLLAGIVGCSLVVSMRATASVGEGRGILRCQVAIRPRESHQCKQRSGDASPARRERGRRNVMGRSLVV